MDKIITVQTPHGSRTHGIVRNVIIGRDEDKNEDVFADIFIREVDYNKDRMRIFDAWSINPEALIKLQKGGVYGICYNDRENNKKYTLKMDELLKMMSGEIKDDKGRKLAWQAEFSGGKTIYIKLGAFKTKDIKVIHSDLEKQS